MRMFTVCFWRIGKMILKTTRLILRPLKQRDAKDIVRNANDLEVSKWLLVVPYPYNLKDAKAWIKHNQEKWKKKEKNDYSFGIELKEEKNLIGAIGLHRINIDQGTAEVGYWIGRKYHRQGYGSEALEAVLDFSFNRLKLRRLEAGVFAGNPSSSILLEKYGFIQEGFKPEARVCKADGLLRDEYLYGLLRKNYLSGKNNGKK
jgi:[ribosomal protein S5]-alanine N-acetyltransferase